MFSLSKPRPLGKMRDLGVVKSTTAIVILLTPLRQAGGFKHVRRKANLEHLSLLCPVVAGRLSFSLYKQLIVLSFPIISGAVPLPAGLVDLLALRITCPPQMGSIFVKSK